MLIISNHILIGISLALLAHAHAAAAAHAATAAHAAPTAPDAPNAALLALQCTRARCPPTQAFGTPTGTVWGESAEDII